MLYPWSVQCLVVIEKALADSHVTAATRLSLTQRARRILQSKAVTKKRKISDIDNESVVSHDAGLEGYTLSDFPEEDLAAALEVRSSWLLDCNLIQCGCGLASMPTLEDFKWVEGDKLLLQFV